MCPGFESQLAHKYEFFSLYFCYLCYDTRMLSVELKQTIKTEPRWYDHTDFLKLYNSLFTEQGLTPEQTLTQKALEIVAWFATALQNAEVVLSAVTAGYNDDDRAGEYQGKDPRDITDIVVHHTGIDRELSIWELEAAGLLLLYLPHFMDCNPNSFITWLKSTHPDLADRPAPASGHYVIRDGESIQSFVGYHYAIYPDGRVVKLLRHDHTAFHAGNFLTNITSIGIAFVGNFSHSAPTQAAKNAFLILIETLKTQQSGLAEDSGMKLHDGNVYSHAQKKLDGNTICPGDWFDDFRKQFEK